MTQSELESWVMTLLSWDRFSKKHSNSTNLACLSDLGKFVSKRKVSMLKISNGSFFDTGASVKPNEHNLVYLSQRFASNSTILKFTILTLGIVFVQKFFVSNTFRHMRTKTIGFKVFSKLKIAQ